MTITAEQAVSIAEKYVLEDFDVSGIEFGVLDGGGEYARSILSECGVGSRNFKEDFWVFVCKSEVEARLEPDYVETDLIFLFRIMLVVKSSLEVVYDNDHVIDDLDWDRLDEETGVGDSAFDADIYAKNQVRDDLVFNHIEVVETMEGREDLYLEEDPQGWGSEHLSSKNSWLVIAQASIAPSRSGMWGPEGVRVRVIGVSKRDAKITADVLGELFESCSAGVLSIKNPSLPSETRAFAQCQQQKI